MKYKKMKSVTLLFFLFLMEASTYSVANSEAKIKLNRKVSESSYGSDEQYIRQIHSLVNAYREDNSMLGENFIIETKALIDTKYRTWKRNADLINSLLALPKDMNDAGR
uniref:Uncharacterized protein n=3 Tax=Bombyx mori TaxID=7091 RepID=A0A8R2HL53_BOMMO|nr:pigment-dispersing factor isoform X1 [Bombyx mori]XP_021202729.1 pigment-dispersing factor isoform X1 [Bombyx mori]XP_021202731.1 pigment-dispersing factor isoform X1 [Bombyx mori]